MFSKYDVYTTTQSIYCYPDSTVLLLPMSSLLEKLAYVVVPEGKETEKVVELDERLLATPTEILGITLGAFNKDDEIAAYNVEPLEQVIDGLKSMLRDRHIVRLADGECTVEAGFVWGDLLTNLERTSDHCSNIATCLIDATHHNMNAHEYKQSLKENNPQFDEKFKFYGEKYKLSH